MRFMGAAANWVDSAALEEEDMIPVRDVEQAAELGLGVVEDLLEHFRSVTHLHD